MPGGDGGDERRCDSGFVQSFRDEEPVVIAEAIVEGDESATQALYQPANGFASVLRLAVERRPGLGRKGKLCHIDKHLAKCLVYLGHGALTSHPSFADTMCSTMFKGNKTSFILSAAVLVGYML